MPKLSRDQQLIQVDKKNPIIYVDLDTPAIPTRGKCVQILDVISTCTTPNIAPVWLKACSWTWYHPRMDKSSIVVNENDIWPVQSLFCTGRPGQPTYLVSIQPLRQTDLRILRVTYLESQGSNYGTSNGFVNLI
ncbi:hypothetical protein PM082_012453 [Marasmius tenuissimus]|nr:hypothetical protein PM082_012453 [Marasmius tenuissimus]